MTGTPWACYGQSSVAAGATATNPTPNAAGLIGDTPALPYIVPTGMTLVLSRYGIEAYQTSGTVVIFPWLGAAPATNAKCLPSCSADAGSNFLEGPFYIPSGEILNFDIINGEPTAQVFGWYAVGCLEPNS
jgi:hypothetical protein